MHTEDRVFPWLGMEDLEQETFEELRKAVRSYNAQHPWLTMSNEEILRSGELIKIAPETGKSGLTLAAVLLFGKQHTIASVLPSYRTDLLCRINDIELYDDREIIRCNLIQAYPLIMAFIKKHLPEQPYIEGMQRFSLRDRILREVVLNLLIHREYSSAYPATFTIYKDTIVTENWNIPYVYGPINLQTLKPHRKNPAIANVFSQMGIVEELGSGTVKMFKYTPLYANGKEPVIEEQDVYRTEIPYIATLQATATEGGLKSGLKSGLKTSDRIVEILRVNPTSSYEIISKELGIARSAIAKHINNLQKANRIRRIGPDKGGHWEVID